MDKPESCIGCPLEKKGISFSIPEGTGSRNIFLIGEGLGDEEARDGLPFRPKAASGSKLDEVFKIVEDWLSEPIRRHQFKLWNLIGCQPPYNLLDDMPWENGAIMHCRTNHFDRILDSVGTRNNRTILALGNLPLKYLTYASGKAVEKQSITHLRGYVYKSAYGLVIPSFHPVYIKRGNPSYTSLLAEDLKKAIAVSKGEFVHRWHQDYVPPVYQDHASLDELQSFYYKVRDNSKLVLTYDIETPTSSELEEDERDDLEDGNITQIQFSLNRNTGLAVPFTSEYRKLISLILATPNTKANHNTWKFDNPRLKAEGMEINGIIHDTMWMFKHYQPNLPRGLQSVASLVGFPFPWKHLYGTKLGWYGCADVDSVQWIISVLPKLMKHWGVWEGYKDHVLRLYSPTLERAQRIGIPVNDEARIILKDSLIVRRDELDAKLQNMIPAALKNIKPSRKDKKTGVVSYGYAKEPKIVKLLRIAYDKKVEELGRPGKKSFALIVFEQTGLRSITDQDGSKTWLNLQPFKTSFDQVSRYIKWKKRQLEASEVKEENELAKFYVIPTVSKVDKKLGERKEKETTGKQALEDLVYETGDEVLETIQDHRSISTTITNFIPNWEPDKRDGCVHTEWGFTAASGQLDSRRPNVLNCSKRTDIGQEFRRIVEAPKGYVFVEMDKRSYHVATMGYLANSKNYIRFSQIDPHSIFTSYIMPSDWGKPVDLSLSDDEIREYCGYIKKRCKSAEVDIRQKVAKPCVLGNQLGLGPRKLWKQNRRFINEFKHAIELQARLADIFPEVKRTQIEILEKAHRQHYLKNDWNRIQWFFEVFSWRWGKKEEKWKRVNGPMAEQALAFPVQSTAFGEIVWDLLESEKLGWNEEYNFCNSIHDSVIFMPRVKQLTEFLRNFYPLFTRPCSVLVNEATGPLGLKVGAEISIGRNWQTFDYFGPGTNLDGMRELKSKEMREEYGL